MIVFVTTIYKVAGMREALRHRVWVILYKLHSEMTLVSNSVKVSEVLRLTIE